MILNLGQLLSYPTGQNPSVKIKSQCDLVAQVGVLWPRNNGVWINPARDNKEKEKYAVNASSKGNIRGSHESWGSKALEPHQMPGLLLYLLEDGGGHRLSNAPTSALRAPCSDGPNHLQGMWPCHAVFRQVFWANAGSLIGFASQWRV